MPRVAPPVSLDSTTKAALDRLLRSPSASQGLVQRSRIILAAAAGKPISKSLANCRCRK